MVDTEWMENIKKIVLQAVEAGDPCDVIWGKVLGVSPLRIQIDQKTILSEKQLLIPMHLKTHTLEIIIPEIGNVTAAVTAPLKVGDDVFLVQKRGGQQFLVTGRW